MLVSQREDHPRSDGSGLSSDRRREAFGDTRPFLGNGEVGHGTGKIRRVVGSFPKAWGGSSGDFRVPEGVARVRGRVCRCGCVEESAGAVARKSLPARLRGRVRE